MDAQIGKALSSNRNVEKIDSAGQGIDAPAKSPPARLDGPTAPSHASPARCSKLAASSVEATMDLTRAFVRIGILSLLLLAVSSAASTTPKDLERESDREFKAHRFAEAVRYLDRALSEQSLAPDLRSHLEGKRFRAQREVDREKLAQARELRAGGRFTDILRLLPRAEDPDVRREEFALICESGDSLAARQRGDLVLYFLRDKYCVPEEAECVAARASLWRAVAPEVWNWIRRSDLEQPELVHAVALGETLMIHAPAAEPERTALASARHRAGQSFARLALEREGRPCAALLHLRQAQRFGEAPAVDSASILRGVRDSLRVAWKLEAPGVTGAAGELVHGVRGLLPLRGASTVVACLGPIECGPGTFEWDEEVKYTANEAGSSHRVFVPGRRSMVPMTVTTQTGQVVTVYVAVPGPPEERTVWENVQVEKTRTEHRSAPAYLVRGEVTFTALGRSRTMPIDVHPHWLQGAPPVGEQMRAAVVDLAAFLQERFKETFTAHSETALARGRAAERAGDDAGADDAYALSALLSGTLPDAAQEYFERKYGITDRELMRAIRLR